MNKFSLLVGRIVFDFFVVEIVLLERHRWSLRVALDLACAWRPAYRQSGQMHDAVALEIDKLVSYLC